MKEDARDLIVVQELSKRYKQEKREVIAVNNISFTVKEGEFVAIVGRSGSGKTTLLSILGTMERPTSGKVLIDGKNLATLSTRELAEMRKNTVATIYQDYNLIPVLTAFQNIELPLILKKMKKEERKKKILELLKSVQLENRGAHKPSELSGGERQRVTIARALAVNPRIIFADEPTGDLDPDIGEGIIQLLLKINRELGTTLVMVTHDLSLAERADRVFLMQSGEFVSIRKGKRAGEHRREEHLSPVQ